MLYIFKQKYFKFYKFVYSCLSSIKCIFPSYKYTNICTYINKLFASIYKSMNIKQTNFSMYVYLES